MSKPKINVTPLIDVLLVLLIIFMVVAPLKPASFKAKLPSEPDPDPTVRPDPRTLIVSIDKNLRLSLNKEANLGTTDDPTILASRLKSIFEQREANGVIDDDGHIVKNVFIRAPKNVGYGNVVNVIDAVKQSGAEPLALQLDHLD